MAGQEKMMVRDIDYVGHVFGSLTVTESAPDNFVGHRSWLCRCVCGATLDVSVYKLRGGHTTSCGCRRGKNKNRHGLSKSKTYNSWMAMRARCENAASEGFENYGGRGIKVCSRWLSFDNFFADMGERPARMTIERNDTNGNYEPSNCRWATWKEQASNTRRSKIATINGESMPVIDWCRKLGLKQDRVYGLIRHRKLTPSEAVQLAMEEAANAA